MVGVLGGCVSVGGGLGLVGGGALGWMGGIPALFPPNKERDMSSCLLPADPDKVRAEISSCVPAVPALLPPDVDEEHDISPLAPACPRGSTCSNRLNFAYGNRLVHPAWAPLHVCLH